MVTLSMRDVALNGALVKVRLTKAISFTSEKRHIVVIGDYLMGFRKEPTHFSYEDVNSGDVIHVDFTDNEKGTNKEVPPYVTVYLGDIKYIRAYDATADCKTFEFKTMVKDESKVFVFECKTNLDMKRWVRVIDSIYRRASAEKARSHSHSSQNEVPDFIRIFSEHGKPGCASMVHETLDELFPELTGANDEGSADAGNDESGSPRSSKLVNELVCGANVLVTFLDDCVDACTILTLALESDSAVGMKNLSSDMAFEALSVVITEINISLFRRFRSVMYDASVNESTGYKPVAERPLSLRLNAQGGLRDLHSLIAWITKYQAKVKAIYCPTKVPTHTHADLFETLPALFDRYVNGNHSSSRRASSSADGAADLLQQHVLKVWETIKRDIKKSTIEDNDPNHDYKESLVKDMEGTFHTQAPSTVWAALNLHLDLAQEAQSALLQVMVADKLADAMDFLARQMCAFMEPREGGADESADTSFTLESIMKTKAGEEHGPEWICAIVNDCGSHIDEVLDIMHNFKHIPEVAEHVVHVFQPVMARLLLCGRLALNNLVRMIIGDLKDQYSQIFTLDWLNASNASPVDTITMTVTDYLSDFKVILVQFWFERCKTLILNAICDEYAMSVVRRAAAGAGVGATSSSGAQRRVSDALSMFSGGGNDGRVGAVLAAVANEVKAGNSWEDGTGKPCKLSGPDAGAALGRLTSDLNALNMGLRKIRKTHATNHGARATIFGESVVTGHGNNQPADDELVAQHLCVCTELVSALSLEVKEVDNYVGQLHTRHLDFKVLQHEKLADSVNVYRGKKSAVTSRPGNKASGAYDVNSEILTDDKESALAFAAVTLSIRGVAGKEQDKALAAIAALCDANISKLKDGKRIEKNMSEDGSQYANRLHRIAMMLRLETKTRQNTEKEDLEAAMARRQKYLSSHKGTSFSIDQNGTQMPEAAAMKRMGPRSSALRRNSGSKGNMAAEAAAAMKAMNAGAGVGGLPSQSVLAAIAREEDNSASAQREGMAGAMAGAAGAARTRLTDFIREGSIQRRDVSGSSPESSSGAKAGAWTAAYIKIISKAVDDGTSQGGLAHTLAFFTKKNGAPAGHTLDLSSGINSILLLTSARAVSYHPRTDRVILHTDAEEALTGQVVSQWEDLAADDKDGFALRLCGKGGQPSVDIKTSDVDDLISWANAFSATTQFSYNMDASNGKWTRAARDCLDTTATSWVEDKKKEKAEREAKKLISSLKGGRRKSLLAAQGEATATTDNGSPSAGERRGSKAQGTGTMSNIAAIMKASKEPTGKNGARRLKDIDEGGEEGGDSVGALPSSTSATPPMSARRRESKLGRRLSALASMADRQAIAQIVENAEGGQEAGSPTINPMAPPDVKPKKQLTLVDPKDIVDARMKAIADANAAAGVPPPPSGAPPGPPGPPGNDVTASPYTTIRKSIGGTNSDGSPAGAKPRPKKRLTGRYPPGQGPGSPAYPIEDDEEEDEDFKTNLASTSVPFGGGPSTPDSSGGGDVEMSTPPHPPHGDDEGGGEDDEYPATPPPRMRTRSSMKPVSSYEEPGSAITAPNSSGKRTTLSPQPSGKRRTIQFGRNECLEYDIASPPNITLVENGGKFRRKSNLPMQMKLKQYSIQDLPDIYPEDDRSLKMNHGFNCCPIM